jgi:dTMP kinase
MKRGVLIAIEGIDRTGKSTQANLLQKYLNSQNKNTELLKFPDRSTIFGKQINSYLTSQSVFDKKLLHLMFSINRWELKPFILKTLLEDKKNLILDRYTYSGIAYSFANGIEWEFCVCPEKGLPKPDVVFYLNTNKVEELVKRHGYGEEVYENIIFQTKVKNVYDTKLVDKNWIVIDALTNISEVKNNISNHLEHVFSHDCSELQFF